MTYDGRSHSRISRGMRFELWIEHVDRVLMFFTGRKHDPALNWRREYANDSDPRTAIENLGIKLRKPEL